MEQRARETVEEQVSAALVASQPTSAALVTSVGAECMTPADLVIPIVHIVQPQAKGVSRGVEKPGTFLSSHGTEKEVITVVPLVAKRFMTWWRSQGDEKPSCSSSDGLRPDRKWPDPPSHTCHIEGRAKLAPVCKLAKWGSGSKETPPNPKDPPACSMGFAIAMWDLDDQTPFIMRFSKTSLQPARVLLSRSVMKRVPLHALQATMRLVKTENRKGVYYVPRFDDMVIVPPSTQKEREELWQQFGGVNLGAEPVEDDQTAGDEPLPF